MIRQKCTGTCGNSEGLVEREKRGIRYEIKNKVIGYIKTEHHSGVEKQ